MAQISLTSLLSLYIVSNLLISGVMSTTFTMLNKCDYMVWPGILSVTNTSPLSTTGFALQKGEFRTISTPTSWTGRMWGRTNCSQDSTGKFSCVTADCGSGKVECSGSGAAPPATIAEFTLNYRGQDFYDVSLVDGYNLQMLVVPQGGDGPDCKTTGCLVDLNGACPPELKVVSSDGKGVGCKSACEAFNQSRYCCTGEYSTPDTCKPTSYSQAFKSACPQAYSYAYDDPSSTFTCSSSPDYTITFCPSPNTSMISILATNWTECYDTGNFTANSTYATNRNLLFSSLTSNITVLNSGFYNTTIGQEPDKVYGLALCRGDVSSEDCSSCVNSTSQQIMSTCHSQKEALMWDRDPARCFVHYADRSLFGEMKIDVPIFTYYKGGNLTSMNLTEFDQIWKPLMDNMTNEASNSELKFATQEATLKSIQTIYALMQCTPDLSQRDCYSCLTRSVSEYINCCHGTQGGGAQLPNCMLRWSLDPFYNKKDIVVAPLPSSPPAPGTIAPPTPGTFAADDGGIPAGTVVIIVVSIIIFMSLVSLAFFFLGKLKQKQIRNNQGRKYCLHHCLAPFVTDGEEMTNTESLQFDIHTIRNATDNFSESRKLGEGGFGPVYKGTLPNGQQVAVKRLFMNSKQGEVEFKNEVTLVARLQHRNLVKLLGFCLEGKERILVYEFLPNSSLDHFIFDPIKRGDLDWERRYRIIEGIARGLLYLHEDSRLRIIHRDLKASNILLDLDMNPKISDFGLARLFEMDQTHVITNRIVGTLGYMAPEYVIHRHFSVKSDVFSFGVIVLELVSGQNRSWFDDTEEELECLLTLAWKKWDEGTASNLIDPTLKEGSRNEMMKCIHIGLLCVQESISDRPTIASVIHMLNSNSITLPSPAKPGFFMQSSVILNASSSSSSSLKPNSIVSTKSDQRRIATAPL